VYLIIRIKWNKMTFTITTYHFIMVHDYHGTDSKVHRLDYAWLVTNFPFLHASLYNKQQGRRACPMLLIDIGVFTKLLASDAKQHASPHRCGVIRRRCQAQIPFQMHYVHHHSHRHHHHLQQQQQQQQQKYRAQCQCSLLVSRYLAGGHESISIPWFT